MGNHYKWRQKALRGHENAHVARCVRDNQDLELTFTFMIMIRTKIRDVDDQSLTHFLNEVGFLCGVNPMDQPGMSLFDFIDFCFNKRGLKKALSHLPTDGILKQKCQDFFGTKVGYFFADLCRLRGVITEGYEGRNVSKLLAACAPGKTSKPRKPLLKTESKTTAIIRQRRQNGDL